MDANNNEKSVEELPSDDDEDNLEKTTKGEKAEKSSAKDTNKSKKDDQEKANKDENAKSGDDQGEAKTVEQTDQDQKKKEEEEKKKDEKSAEQMKKEFFDTTTNEAIDDNMMAYISVTRVKQLISKVMEPVLYRAKQESDYAKRVNTRMDDLAKEFSQANDKIEMLKRKASTSEEINKQFARMQADFVNFQQSMDNELRNSRSAIENHKYEIQRVVREHEADAFRLERVQQVALKVDRDFGTVQNKQTEMLGMHSEEFNTKTNKIKGNLQDIELKLNQIEYEKDHINMDIKDMSTNIAKLTEMVRDLTAQCEILGGQVVDCTQFEKKQKLFNIQMEQFDKRLNQMDQNNCHYGSFVVRYLPLSYMIAMAEHLANSGSSKQIKSLKHYLDAQSKVEIKPIKTRKYNFIGDIDEYKDRLIKKFNEVRMDLNMKIAPAQKEEQKEQDDLAKILETKVEERLKEVNTVLQDFEKKIDEQQDEAFKRMDTIHGELKERINSAVKGSSKKDKKKEKLKKLKTKGKDELSDRSSQPEESVSPGKKDKKSKKKKKNDTAEKETEEIFSGTYVGNSKTPEESPTNFNESDNDKSKKSQEIHQATKTSPSIVLEDLTSKEEKKKKKKDKEKKDKDDDPEQVKKDKSKQKIDDKNDSKEAVEDEDQAAPPQKKKKNKKSKDKKNDEENEEVEKDSMNQKSSQRGMEQPDDKANKKKDKKSKDSKKTVMFDHMRSQDAVESQAPVDASMVQQQSKKDKQSRRVQIMVPQNGEEEQASSDIEIQDHELERDHKHNSTTPSAKNLPKDKPLIPIIKIPNKAGGSVHQLVSSDRGHADSVVSSSYVPQTEGELEGGAKSKSSKLDSARGPNSMMEAMDSDDIEEEEKSDDSSSEEQQKLKKPQVKNEKTRADEESSEEEGDDSDEDDSDQNDSDNDSSSSLGIDLSNYYTKEEAEKMLKDQILETKNKLQGEYLKLTADLKTDLDVRAGTLEHRMATLEADTERTLQERLDKMTTDIECVLRSQQREKSDLQSLNQKLIDKIDILTKKVEDVNESIESICTITLCLIESQCMQIRAEEVDEEDKVNISLMGYKEQKQMEESTNFDSVSQNDIQGQGSDRSPRSRKRTDQQAGIEKSVALDKQGFPLPLGHKPTKTNYGVKFIDKGNNLPDAAQKLLNSKPKPRNLLEIDPVCLSCTAMQADIIKKFKVACLAYAPSPVIFRNIQFSRPQILVFRKFLMGQCSKIAHLKEPYKSLRMSTKRIFDDMYLFLKEANMKNLQKLDQNTVLIDEMNGMPKNSYLEISSQYWNLIYKNSMAEEAGGKKVNQKPTLTVSGIESEFDQSQLYGGQSEMMRMNPVIIKREKNSKNYSTSRGAQSRLDSSTHHDRTMDRNSIFDLHARDSMDSMRISQQKQVDFTSRKQSAGVKQRNENESNTLMQASRNDSNKYAYKADNSIVKFQSPFKNQTPKTAHSQLGQNRSRLRDNLSKRHPQPINVIDDSAAADSIQSNFVDQVRANAYGAAFQLRNHNPTTGASLHQMMQYPMQGRHNLGTAVGPRDRMYQTLQSGPDQLISGFSKNLPPLQQQEGTDVKVGVQKVNKHMLKLKLDKLQNNNFTVENTGRAQTLGQDRGSSITPQPNQTRRRVQNRSVVQ